MSDPYASVAENYDIMIDWPARLARERPFCAALFAEHGVKWALDVGCGTGHHARMFTELGATVVGLDPSAPMLARAKALTEGGNPRFVRGGFAEIPSLHEQFDFIAVLGNTLAHVEDARGLTEALTNMRGALAPGGLLCIHLINYDSLLTEGSRRLPVIDRQAGEREFIFLREHRCTDRKAEFTIITLIRAAGKWSQQVERDSHLPLTGDVLRPALQCTGFAQVTLLGSYAGEPFEPKTSPNFIILAGS